MNDKSYYKMPNGRFKINNIALLGLFSAFAIILGYIEFLIPVNIPIYGFKLGFSNIATVLVLYLFDVKWSGIVLMIRISVINLLFGTIFSFAFSLCGGIISLIGMWFVYRFFKGSMTFSSAIGGLLHNITQLIVASFLLGTDKILYLVGILSIVGIVTGILVGISGYMIYIRIHKYIENIRKGRFC